EPFTSTSCTWKPRFGVIVNDGVAPSATAIEPLGEIEPFAPALATTVQPVIEKFVWLESEPMLPVPSCASTRTRAWFVSTTGSVHAYVPVFERPVAIEVGNVAPPFVDSARSIVPTTMSSVAVHVMLWTVPAPQLSPPTGDVIVTVGGVVSGVPLIVSVWPFDVPPPGAGVNTVIVFVAPAAWSVAVMIAVTCPEFTNVVARSDPSIRTIEHAEKPEPFTVSENCGSPAERTLGAIEVVAGDGFVLATAK